MVNITSRLGDLANWSAGYITGSGSIDTTGANRYALNSEYKAGVAGDRDLEFSVSYNFPQGTSEGSGAICVSERDGANNVVAYTESTSAVGEIPLPIHIRLNERTVYVEVAGRYLGSTYNGTVALLYDPPMVINADVNNGYPYNVLPEEVPTTKAMVQPYPDSWWRIQAGYNNGYPFNMLMPDIPTVDLAPPVKQRPYICLYRYDTPQNGFDNHGMFVLTPTKCTITEELNGKYEISLEHPIDPEGRWQYIRENAIVKAMGQLFTIRVVNQQWKGSSGKITAKGDHIWYQLGDRWLAKTSGETEGISSIWVSTLVSKAREKLVGAYFEGDTHYSFTPYIQNGLYVPQGIGEGRWEFLTEGMTPIEFFLGSQGVVAACEGEFHRDNFNFYINKRKHGSSDNAFDIRIGKNLTAIKRTIDTSSLVTYVEGYTNYDKEGTQPYGGTFAISWTDSLLADYGIPHHIYREKEFSYNFPINWVYGDGETKVKKLLAADVKEWFRQNNQPLIAYEIDMRDVKNNPEYQELVNVDSYKVGDMGYIHDPHIGDIQIEITKSVTNAITGEVEQVVFGNVRDFVGQPPSQLVIDPETVVVEVYFQVMDSSGAFCYDRNGDMIVEYEGV